MENVRRPLWIMAVAAAALSGCADYSRLQALAPSGVDGTSAAAGAVRSAQASRPAYPDLARLPPRPADLRAPAAYGAAAGELRGGRASLEGWRTQNPPLVDDVEGFAAAEQGRIPPSQRDAPAAEQAARSAAWAAQLREAAKPPPPPGG